MIQAEFACIQNAQVAKFHLWTAVSHQRDSLAWAPGPVERKLHAYVNWKLIVFDIVTPQSPFPVNSFPNGEGRDEQWALSFYLICAVAEKKNNILYGNLIGKKI